MLHLVSIDLLSLSLILGLILAQEIHHFKFIPFFHEILRKSLEFFSFQIPHYKLQ